MEIKHTVEILTKDIQDIEKLVRNLNNYETPPQIEIDLAMSRLRNVYDLLLLISSDLKKDKHAGQEEAGQDARGSSGTAPSSETSKATGQASAQQQESGTEQVPKQEHTPTQQEVRTPQQQQTPQQDPAPQQQQPQQDSSPQQQQSPQQDPAPQQQVPPPQRQQAPQQDPAPQQQDTVSATSRAVPSQESAEKPEETPPAEQPSSQPAGEMKKDEAGTSPGTAGSEQKKKEEAKKTSILAEKFASDKSLNEKIAPGSGHDLSSRLTGEPIDSIKRNIGINDRFLIIRELLDGNSDAFNDLVQKLDTQHHFDEAYEIIRSSFPDQMEHEGVNLLVRLSRRRYLGR